ncbi:MAG TPA: MFS transporter [Spirillospora sp.]|nr:MFS transporter [Spirillospora sp.]
MTPDPANDAIKPPAGFGRLWTAQTVSSLGDGVTQAALPLIALSTTRDPMALAVVTAAGTLPWLLFGVLGGALVDRWDRRRTMWVTDAARAILLGRFRCSPTRCRSRSPHCSCGRCRPCRGPPRAPASHCSAKRGPGPPTS